MKVWNYVIISVGLAFLFELAGMPVATSVLNWIGLNPTGVGLKTSAMYLAIFGGAGFLITAVVGGITIGFFTKSSPENYIIAPFIGAGITIFLTTFIGIINYSITNFEGWISYVTLFIMGILGTGFVIACIEFFRGTD